MKMKKIKYVLLGLSFALVISKTNTLLFSTGSESNDRISYGEYIVEDVPGSENARELELLEISEYEEWMEQQCAENQNLANSGDKSFYYKNTDGIYVCREWTQEDVDTLYAQWQEQLVLMKQGYHFTKTIVLSDGGGLVGEFSPETWNAKTE